MENQKVIVIDFNMPFWSMVKFMIKWVLASIPALFIISILAGLLSVFFMAGVASLQQSIQQQRSSVSR